MYVHPRVLYTGCLDQVGRKVKERFQGLKEADRKTSID